MKKRLLASLLAAMMMVSMMATTAFAAELEAVEEPEVHCVTMDLIDVFVLGADNMAKTVDPSLGLGGYQSGWSSGVKANFSLSSTATVVGVKVTPGRAVADGPVTSVIAVSKFKVTAPNGTSAEVSFKSSGAETTELKGGPASGSWTLSMYGQNIGADYNSVKYIGTTITVYYKD